MTCQDARYIIALYSEDEDGDVTDRINLADGASYGVGPGGVYAPPPPQKVSRGADSIYRHGSDVVRARYGNSAVEIRELTILGEADILAERIMRITTMLEKARLRQERGWGEKVFIERDWRYSTYYAWDIDPGPEYFYEAVDVLKKEVYRGEFVPPREDVGAIIGRGTLAPCRLNLECYPFWQGREQNVWNNLDVENDHCDVYPPATQNFLDLSADDLPGDAPCLLRLRIENEYNTTGTDIHVMRVGIKQRGTPGSWVGTFQAEDMTKLGGYTAFFSCAECSCQTGLRVTPTGITSVPVGYATIAGADFQDGLYKPYIRIRNNATEAQDVTIKVQAWLFASWAAPTVYLLWQGPEVTIFNSYGLGNVPQFTLEDLGLLEIPTAAMEGYRPLTYRLYIYTQADKINGGTFTHDIDYVFLLPVEGGLKLTQLSTAAGVGPGLGQGCILDYNGLVQPPMTQMYCPSYPTWLGSPVSDLGFLAYLEPNQDYRFFFSADKRYTIDRTNDVEQTFKVTLDIIPQYMYIR